MTTALLPEQQALVLATARYIEDYPNEYDQGEWCGTRRCVAGTAAWIVSGGNMDADNMTCTVNNVARCIWDAAGDAMGLSDTARRYLFDAEWSPHDVPEALRAVAFASTMEEIETLTWNDVNARDEEEEDEW